MILDVYFTFVPTILVQKIHVLMKMLQTVLKQRLNV